MSRQSAESLEAVWREPYLQDQQLRVLLRELLDDYVHLLAWLCP